MPIDRQRLKQLVGSSGSVKDQRASRTIVASCGHEVEFLYDEDDPNVAKKIARIKERNCRNCRVRAEQEKLRQQEADKKAKQGRETLELPKGSKITMLRGQDYWECTLEADGITVQVKALVTMGASARLARKWLNVRDHTRKSKQLTATRS